MKTNFNNITLQNDFTKNDTVMQTKNVNLFYGNFHALKDISLDIYANSVTALIGPSGCGKSTFIRLFNRMNDLIDNVKITGDISFYGKNIYDPDVDINELRKKIGMVFQKPNPFPKSIYENIAYGLRVNGIRNKAYIDDIVIRSIIKVGLWEEVKDKLKKSAYELSGGQQQRLCIARAIAVKPSVILMDEPTSSLDPISVAHIEELINELKKNYTIIIVTHSMQQAARISDMTAFFYMGQLIEYDRTSKIFTNPSNEKTQNYITGRFG